MSDNRHSEATIAFAEKVLELLDHGSFTATYKHAVLLALIDLVLERSDVDGEPPVAIDTSALAEKVVAFYWPHTLPFSGSAGTAVLRQNTSGQAEIVSLIERFREAEAPDPSAPLFEARLAAPEAYARLIRDVEWKLIEMPLPRLQVVGATPTPFIYDIHWDQTVRRRRAFADDFDRRITLREGVGEHLLRLSGLLRPLIQREWTTMVSHINRELVPDSRLEAFLFGVGRIPLDRLRPGLRDLQGGRCFYSQKPIRSRADVDHFIPWSRYADNGIDNLVLSDAACNNAKRNFLAAVPHLERWLSRPQVSGEASRLRELPRTARWDRHPKATLAVATAIYGRLPSGAKLWIERGTFVDADPRTLSLVLGTSLSS